MSEHRDLDTGALGFGGFYARPPLSASDPDVLARAVRAHKTGDAVTQAFLTLTLMVAIGAVAFVLSAGRAAAAGLFSAGDLPVHGAMILLAALGAVGGSLLLATSLMGRRALARARRQNR